MKYKLHIPYANRIELLRDAVELARDIGNIHVWSDGAPLPDPPIENATLHDLPPVTAVDVINHMIKSSLDDNDDVMFWMHNDGFAKPGIAKDFLSFTTGIFNSRTDGHWGVIFTMYDILCAFNMKAVRELGYWDNMFFQYVADVDYYHRMRKAGLDIIEYGKAGILHRNAEVTPEHDHGGGGSNTIKADPLFNYRTQWRNRTKFDDAYFQFKWGAPKHGYEQPLQGSPQPFASFPNSAIARPAMRPGSAQRYLAAMQPPPHRGPVKA